MKREGSLGCLVISLVILFFYCIASYDLVSRVGWLGEIGLTLISPLMV